MLELGKSPALQACIVKDLGALFEQEIPEVARHLVEAEPSLTEECEYSASLATSIMAAPSFSLREARGKYSADHCSWTCLR